MLQSDSVWRNCSGLIASVICLLNLKLRPGLTLFINFIVSGKGLFAKCSIPANTVLGVYPGDHLTKDEMLKRSHEREEEDRFVFQYENILLVSLTT